MKHISSLKRHPLFDQMSDDEIKQLLTCFSFVEKHYAKGDYIFLDGELVEQVGIILNGTVLMEKSDIGGNSYFFTELREHEIFAEPFMGIPLERSSVNYKAMTNCDVLFFNYQIIWSPCSKHCNCHMLFIRNLTNLLALKSRSLLAKIEILSKKSLRDRILTFLYIVKNHHHLIGMHIPEYSEPLQDNQVFIPFNHTEMAEYLSVNRSAFVRELTKMKKDGILEYKNHIYSIIDSNYSHIL